MSCIFLIGFTSAQIPQTMSYQGILTDNAGNPVADGTASMTFRLYDVAEQGAALWEETQDVTTSNGLFNVILGSENGLNLPFDEPYWLGITIGTEAELEPRIALTASPYSLNAISNIIEPEAGQSFMIRDSLGEPTHVLSQNGDVNHLGKGTFGNGLEVILGDTSEVLLMRSGNPDELPELVLNGDGAILGFSSSGTGVTGGSDDGVGVRGVSEIYIGVLGESAEYIGVYGWSLKRIGVVGYSEGNEGVFGHSKYHIGVHGKSDGGFPGVLGEAENWHGVEGIGKYDGVYGQSEEGNGISGWSRDGVGVLAYCVNSWGVHGISDESIGVRAWSKNSIGLYAEGKDVAAQLKGDVLIEDDGKLKIDNVPEDPQSEKFLVWSDDKFVKYRTLPGIGGDGEWFIDGANLSVTGKNVLIKDAQGNVMTQFNADGTSLHKGLETYEAGISVPLGDDVYIEINPELGMAIWNPSTTMYNFHANPSGDALVSGTLWANNINVSGTLTKPAGSFMIDHPLEPEDKILYHSFVESPDMMNIYNGNVVLDANGEAWIELPDWFGALNRDFRYQLTCIGGFAQVYVAEEIQNNRFKIAGGYENLKVSWQVTGIRQDAYAEANRIQVEQEKSPEQQGKYLHPEVFGKSESDRMVMVE